ncbi:succinate--CoA ligase subunit alpha [Anaeromyxobacter paludicola]|uniref:Succinate--CoA ligase [ADP-forming] subunit alpha n=1 Tax=Anaeromyxobacter paludicola TaxID=2918171 RepID=A0ABN6N3H3_9BACT|nr:succinate--CoA ligase subunit alpha [Anaeromyxobacter paludicola]BDG07730.1 succinate--CoA ligase [ADP-forming] subunit alpha [Anaeromyxobacter paludicola]
MSIFVDRNTRVVVQGITGSAGSFHAEQMLEYGTRVVAGVTPGRGGTRFANVVPIFHTVEQAVRDTGANASVIFVPPPFAADAIIEAAEAGVTLVVAITEGIPILDMVKVRRYLADRPGVRLIGPNCPGVITPGQCKIGIMPGHIHRPGRVGIVSRSGTLTYEAVDQISRLGMGQSTAVGIGGDPIHGTDFIDCLSRFEADPETESVIMIGEIGGSEETLGAEWVKKNMTKPVVGFIAGRTAPPGKRMGHAGAVISGGADTAQAKLEAMREAGIVVCEGPHLLGQAMKDALSRRKGRVKAKPAAERRPAPGRAPAQRKSGGAPRGAPPTQRGGKAVKKAAKR